MARRTEQDRYGICLTKIFCLSGRRVDAGLVLCPGLRTVRYIVMIRYVFMCVSSYIQEMNMVIGDSYIGCIIRLLRIKYCRIENVNVR